MLSQTYFCIGAAKTGTTILARLLDQQPDVACIWEGYFLKPRHRSSLLNAKGEAWLKHGLSAKNAQDWNERATRQIETQQGSIDAIRESATLREIVREVFGTFGDLTNASVVGDKWPYYYRSLAPMLEAFPDAKFVYNVRDPRAVWNSGETFRARGVGDETLQDMLKADDRIRQYAPDDRFITIRYEDLITATEATMQSLADFIGFEFHPSALAYDASLDPMPSRWAWVPTAAGDVDVALTEKWRTEMSLDDQARITEQCGDFIGRYGYDRLAEL